MTPTRATPRSHQGAPASTTTSAIARVSVVLHRQGQEYPSVRHVKRHDEWGDEKDVVDIAAEALERAVRDVYGRRAYWQRDHGTSSSLMHRTDLQIYEYGNVLRDLTDQERQQGHANVIASRVQAEVYILG